MLWVIFEHKVLYGQLGTRDGLMTPTEADGLCQMPHGLELMDTEAFGLAEVNLEVKLVLQWVMAEQLHQLAAQL